MTHFFKAAQLYRYSLSPKFNRVLNICWILMCVSGILLWLCSNAFNMDNNILVRVVRMAFVLTSGLCILHTADFMRFYRSKGLY